jgi:hypothetical protein
MKTRTIFIPISIFLSIIFFFSAEFCSAQEDSAKSVSVDLGTDMVSRYVWRGLPWEESFCIQPSLSLKAFNFSFGIWGSYSLTREIMDECDLYLSYTLSTKKGDLSAYLYDYHNPNFNGEFFNFKGDGEGSHVLELYLQFDGADNFPLTFLIGYNIHNDPDKSKYFEAGYKFSVNDVNLNIFCGATSGTSEWYNVDKDKLAIINTGINASKKIKITDSFSPMLGVSYILNPYVEKSYLIFKISL